MRSNRYAYLGVELAGVAEEIARQRETVAQLFSGPIVAGSRVRRLGQVTFQSVHFGTGRVEFSTGVRRVQVRWNDGTTSSEHTSALIAAIEQPHLAQTA